MGNTMSGYDEEKEVSVNPFEDAVTDAYDKINNRGAFSYSANNDPTYQQYKKAAEKSGKLAMKDTIGQIAAMNGGYANSYAQSAGQQVYQSALDNVDNMIPELYEIARQRYDNETAALQDRFDAATDAYEKWAEENAPKKLTPKEIADAQEYLGRLMEDANIAYTTNGDISGYSDMFTYLEGLNLDESELPKWLDRYGITDEIIAEIRGDVTEPQNVEPGTTDEEVYGPIYDPIAKFTNSVYSEEEHDAIQRQMYGPYQSYLAAMLASADYLTEDEKAYLISLYGITEDHFDYLDDKGVKYE